MSWRTTRRGRAPHRDDWPLSGCAGHRAGRAGLGAVAARSHHSTRTLALLAFPPRRARPRHRQKRSPGLPLRRRGGPRRRAPATCRLDPHRPATIRCGRDPTPCTGIAARLSAPRQRYRYTTPVYGDCSDAELTASAVWAYAPSTGIGYRQNARPSADQRATWPSERWGSLIAARPQLPPATVPQPVPSY